MSKEYTASECFALLADRRRRHALSILSKCATATSIDELTERIADREFEEPSAEDRRAVRLALLHVHLPRLEDADVVAFGDERDTVRLRPRADDLVRAMRWMIDGDVPRTVRDASDSRSSA